MEENDIVERVNEDMQESHNQIPTSSVTDVVRPWSQATQAKAGGASTSGKRIEIDAEDDDDFGVTASTATTVKAARAPAARKSRTSSSANVDDDRNPNSNPGRGRGRGRGRATKQTTLDAALVSRPRRASSSAAAAMVDNEEDEVPQTPPGNDEDELQDPESDAEPVSTRGRKRAAPSIPRVGRGRNQATPKRGRTQASKSRSLDGDEEDEKNDASDDDASDEEVAVTSTRLSSWSIQKFSGPEVGICKTVKSLSPHRATHDSSFLEKHDPQLVGMP